MPSFVILCYMQAYYSGLTCCKYKKSMWISNLQSNNLKKHAMILFYSLHMRLEFFNVNASYINGLVQDCSMSIANALEIVQYWTKPSIYFSSLNESERPSRVREPNLYPCRKRTIMTCVSLSFQCCSIMCQLGLVAPYIRSMVSYLYEQLRKTLRPE